MTEREQQQQQPDAEYQHRPKACRGHCCCKVVTLSKTLQMQIFNPAAQQIVPVSRVSRWTPKISVIIPEHLHVTVNFTYILDYILRDK